MDTFKIFFRRFLYVLAFFAIIFVSILVVWMYKGIPIVPLDPFSYVPSSAMYILETDEPVDSWDEISSSKLWKHLQTQPYFGELTKDAISLDTLIHQNREILDLVGKRQVLVSSHIHKQGDYDFLFIVDLKREIPEIAQEIIGKTMISVEDSSNYDYKGNRIYLIKNTSDNSQWAISVRKHLLLCSQTPALIEAALDERENSNNFENNRRFTKVVSKTSSRNLGRLFINYDLADEFFGLYMDESNEYLNDISEALFFSGLNLDLEQIGDDDDENASTIVRMIGTTVINDSIPSHVRALLNSGNSDITAARVVPQRSAFYFSVNFDDFLTYYDKFTEVLQRDQEAYQEYQNQIRTVERLLDINVRDNFFSWIGSEIAIIQSETTTSVDKNDEYALVLKTTSISEATAQLEFIGEKIRKRTPVKVVVSEHKGHKISMLAVKGFFKLVMGKYFEKIDKPYFTFIEDYVIFSNSPKTLKNIIDDYEMGLTLAKSPSFQNFFDEFDAKNSNFFAYVNMPVALKTLKRSLSPETWKTMQQNSNYVISQPHWGFQLRRDETNFYDTRLVTVYENPQKVRNDYKLAQENRKKLLEQLNSKNILEKVFGTEEKIGLFEQLQTIPESELIQLDKDNAERRLIVQNKEDTRYEYEVKGTIKDGIYREFKAGKLIIEGYYENNKRDGKWRFYDNNGKIKERKRYKDGEESKFSLF
ncbi:Protein of unknown function (DUF3352) [Bernardetia litoralis DSM 6794]|uniref:MORN repeat protein n=1 Tax=Bernardetia litoralis (strain ATCC 23117 / DSM 6794 / NBRC 15988 / NCIMB 1366 / Fx l1 / Sio-4) TaxID=880071 RepID=I4APV2_BERLS|nr:DUF3352 domain-containing protein [Bernardetia litoralis]AFM05987.1 Protein of unknown function (DUF3352) [Bernardetia litoralis DSM 6794]